MEKASIILPDIARIARVPEANRASFLRLLGYAIATSERESSRPAGKNISAGALSKDFFSPIALAAKRLRNELERLHGDNLTAAEAPRSMAACRLFSDALRPSLQLDDHDDPIAHLLCSLDLGLVIAVAESATARARNWFPKSGRKKGTGIAAFDMFVMELLQASEQTGGRLTIYRTSYEDYGWAGSLLKALEQLRPFLPKTNFFPGGKLGHSLHSVHRRWLSEAGKSHRKKR